MVVRNIGMLLGGLGFGLLWLTPIVIAKGSLSLGVGLIGVGLLLMVAGWLMARRAAHSTPANIPQHDHHSIHIHL